METGKTLLIKIPTRERGFDWLKDYTDNITNPNTKILLTLDYGDVSVEQARELNIIYPNVSFTIGISNSKIEAVNRDMKVICQGMDWDVILVGSDDMKPIKKGFDQVVLDFYNEKNSLDFLLWTSDGYQNRIPTIPIMGRDYYERFKYIYHPNFKSFFCDNFSLDIAKKLGKLHKLDTCLLSHQHPAWGGERKQDALYTKNDTYWKQDEKMYKQMVRDLNIYV